MSWIHSSLTPVLSAGQGPPSFGRLRKSAGIGQTLKRSPTLLLDHLQKALKANLQPNFGQY